jgi:hypothetical protein
MSSLLWANKQLEVRGKVLAFNNERSNKRHTKTTKMTDDQINKAIAEVLGWTDIIEHPEFGLMGVESETHCCRTGIECYTHDLNAMHEAEQHLWRKDWFMRYDYVDELGKLQNPHNWQRMEASDMLDATARQRAEAFLRTLGKWEENK